MTRFLLDSNIVSDLVRNPKGKIAAHALALGHVIVTDNEREFARIDGLTVENWLRQE